MTGHEHAPTLDDMDLADAPGTPEEWDAVEVTDDETLTRILRWAAAHKRRLDRIRAIAEPEIDRIQAWATEQSAPHADRLARLERAAEEYVTTRRSVTGGKVKSLRTPFGTASTSLAGGGWEVTDLDALLSWAEKSRPELVNRPPATFALADAKAVLKAVDKSAGGEVLDPGTNEIVPGLKTVPQVVKAKVALGGAE